MEIQIHNYLSGSFLLESKSKQWDSIVILDSSLGTSEFVTKHSRNSLQLHFDDIVKPMANKVPPDSKSVKAALEFGVESKRLIVCCRAGQSRSAAIAFSIAFEKWGENEAKQLLNAKRHSPNERILRLADPILNRTGLVQTFDDWWQDNQGIRLTDFLDAIENEYDELEAKGARNKISVR